MKCREAGKHEKTGSIHRVNEMPEVIDEAYKPHGRKTEAGPRWVLKIEADCLISSDDLLLEASHSSTGPITRMDSPRDGKVSIPLLPAGFGPPGNFVYF